MIYLDNAATSWPKPDCVQEAMLRYMRDIGASPGRSAHRLAVEAERVRFDAREVVAELLGLSDPMRVIFLPNGTAALNLVIQGMLPAGSHALTTGMEHNAVMRPLRAVRQHGVHVSVVPCRPDGTLDPETIDDLIQPNTRLIVVNHASNVCGTVLPIRAIGAAARRHGVPFLVDAAQTVGCHPIDINADNIDLLAFTGHKGMLGPSGTGGLAIHDRFDVAGLPPLTHGGTGSLSEQDRQPDLLPDKYEAGTPNFLGIAGLAAGVRYILDHGVDRIHEYERRLTQGLIDGLKGVPTVRVFGTCDAGRQTATVSFTIEDQSVSNIAHRLDERFGIMCRPGLHCAPQAHRTIGTFPHGTLRFAPGSFTTDAEIDQAVDAVARLASAKGQ